ncbi:MAG: hypothetical protein COX07_03410, partial [Bacteroidetes bacterium CG23_combo_of_CG06-09_8_20_14_all_32_9]
MFRLFLIFVIIYPYILFSQNENKIILKGSVYSVSDDEPVSYASVRISSTTIGTITAEDGK